MSKKNDKCWNWCELIRVKQFVGKIEHGLFVFCFTLKICVFTQIYLNIFIIYVIEVCCILHL